MQKLPSKMRSAPSPAKSTEAGLLQRKCTCGGTPGPSGECDECRKKREKELLQREISTAGMQTQSPAPAATEAPPIVHDVLRSSGQPLAGSTRAFMESRFGQDFSRVRIHTDAQASASAQAVSAAAYTVHDHIVFGSGKFSPQTAGGRQLLAHELTHVSQQGARGPVPAHLKIGSPSDVAEKEADQVGRHIDRSQAGQVSATSSAHESSLQRAPAEEVSVFAPKKTCEDSLDITEVFRGFMRNYPKALAAMPGLTDEQRKGHQAMLDLVLKNEGGVDVMKMTVLSCKKINLDLQVGDEKFSAYFDGASKTIGLSKEFVTKLTTALQDKDAFLEILSVLAHEKRHATLGGSVSVPLSGLKNDPNDSKAQNAAYRVEEILTTAEEVAVQRMAMGSSYEVPEGYQRKLYRLNNMIRGWVTEAEAKRLRKLVIDKLRDRYGFTDGCDNALTVGIVRCMDKNEWFSCDRANRTIYGAVPEGLTICTDKHAFCRENDSPAKP